MAQREFRQLDRVKVSITGKGAKGVLSAAAGAGIRLRSIRSCGEGYSASLPGRDWKRLNTIAREKGAEVAVLQKRGPGGLVARLWLRPGLLFGCLLFFFLVHFLSGYIWTIQFGALEQQEADLVRSVLDANGLREGTRVTEDQLAQAGQALEAQPELFGWAGLHFTDGCLFVETTPLQQQQIRPQTEQMALYAAADAEIVQIEVESGFVQVVPGQLVAKGQLLAAAERFDRDGNAVLQSASGSVIGRVRTVVTAEQAYEQIADILTGETRHSRTLYLLGREFQMDGKESPPANAELQEEWTPLVLGRIALPGCIRTTEYRTKRQVLLHYTQETAQALARRNCMQQLLEAYPDAEIEQQSFDFAADDNGVICRADFVFCADIAEPGTAQPLTPPAGE